ncbi:hypothetical protein L2X99_12820 [Microbacterium sp. KUDC0406]|uniref:hypothetical protein n=1 Tax=Microbacterium sp. KUDC0406 TaxID=2909588 RepID=UPI001F3B21B6|nr:hypothetical protein [Microbacterium sp. KUDC0406]UJP09311.1 hypothetical protein L2X99_12820 [Microbacterium sp. KUDC0406]
MRKAAATIVLCVAAVALSSCVADTGSPQDDVPFTSEKIKAISDYQDKQGNREQAEILSDGEITEDEYWQALTALRECVESKGYGFSEPVLSPVTGITYEFVYYGNGRAEDQVLSDTAACESKYWEPTSSAFQSTHEQVMDRALRTAVLSCLDHGGHPGVADGRNLAEISPVIDDDFSTREAARECTSAEAQKLYPNLPSVTVID